MKKAEKTIKCFLAQKNIPSGASIYEIGTALNIREGETIDCISEQAHLSNPDEDGIMFVTLGKV